MHDVTTACPQPALYVALSSRTPAFVNAPMVGGHVPEPVRSRSDVLRDQIAAARMRAAAMWA